MLFSVRIVGHNSNALLTISMLSVVPSVVLSGHVFAVPACLSYPSYIIHTGLVIGLGLGMGTENSIISILLSDHAADNSTNLLKVL